MPTPQPDGSDTAPVYILAGGRSRRFGRDKARSLVDGVPLIVGVAGRLQPVASSIIVVAREQGQYNDLGLTTIGDSVEAKGPLGGLLTAIEHCGAGRWLFLTACDWIGTRVEWYRELAAQRNEGSQAVVYRSDRLEPLFGFYHTSIRDIVTRQIDRNELAMHELLPKIGALLVPAPREWAAAINLNQPGSPERD